MIARIKVPVLRVLTICLLALAWCWLPASAHAQEDRTAKVETLFREGVDMYQQGRYSDAQRKLREVLALEPRKELAARLVDEAGTRVMAQMMANPRMGAEPTYIWQLYRKYYIGKLADTERMAKMAARVVDPETSEDERALLYREFQELGHYALPVLAKYLGDKEHADFRTQARVIIARMGPRAVLPVIELVTHGDLIMRENAVMALSDIEPLDERALPALKAVYEKADATPTEKRLAARAMERISGLPVDQMKPATTYYYEAANRYYLERAGVPEEAEMADGYIWHLNEAGELVPVLYPLWAWNEQMAEELVLRGMNLDLDNTDFYPLAACIWGQQYTEVKDLVDLIKEQPAQHFFSEEEKQQVMAWDQKLIDCRNLVSACGKFYVNAGLNKVLRDMSRYKGHPQLPGTGVFLADQLKDLDPYGSLLPAPGAMDMGSVGVDAATAEAIPSPPEVTTIEVSPPAATIPAHGTQQFSAVVKDQYGNAMAGIGVKWSVQGGGTIDETGMFTAGEQGGGPWPVVAEAVVEGGMGPKGEAKADVAGAEGPGMRPTKPNGHNTGLENDLGPTPNSSALVNCLDSGDQNIQYAGAKALAHINKFPDTWAGSEKVALLLGRGVSENKPIQVLVVDEDHNTRNTVRMHLEALGLGATDAVSGRDALIKARSFPPKDVIIVGDNLIRDLTPEQLMEELKADIRTRYVPVGILHATSDRKAAEARYGAEIALVEREAKDNDLKVQIEKLAAMRPAEAVTKVKAHNIAVSCAQSLANLDARWTHVRLGDAVPHCVGALKNRHDDVRIPAATAIGTARGGAIAEEASDRLKDVFVDGNNVTPLRLAALKSMSLVSPQKYADVYLQAQTDPEHVLQEWAATGFGRHERTNKELYEFLRAKRVDKDKKEK